MVLKIFSDYLNKLYHGINCFHRQPNHAQKPQWHHKCNKILRKKNQIGLIVARKEINKKSNPTADKILEKLVDKKKKIDILNNDFIHVKSYIDQPILAFFLFLD